MLHMGWLPSHGMSVLMCDIALVLLRYGTPYYPWMVADTQHCELAGHADQVL